MAFPTADMNADELASLHPLQISPENRYHAPGARLELEFLENDDNSGLFDSEIEWAATELLSVVIVIFFFILRKSEYCGPAEG